MDYTQFYKNFGNLLYAIAMADGYIQMSEYAEFAEIVSNELQPLEDKFGHESSLKTLFEFRELSEKNVDVDHAFEDFVDFLKANRSEIDGEIKELCIRAAEKLAGSYEGIDQEERMLIDRLKKELSNL